MLEHWSHKAEKDNPCCQEAESMTGMSSDYTVLQCETSQDVLGAQRRDT